MTRRKASRPDELFLSHSSRDRAFVSKLATTLRSHGLNVWYSETNLVGAQQWHDEIGRALGRCNWFVAVLSKDSVKSRWVKRELLYALRSARFENRIVPLMLKPCEPELLSWTLPDFQSVDFTGGFDRGCGQLLRVWGLAYQR